jgi:hypothetical protein
MAIEHVGNNTDRENRCIWRKILTSTWSTTNPTWVVLESKEVLAMRVPRLTSSATAPSILATDVRCQLFCILFLTSCIPLSHGICSKFEYTLGTILLDRTCRNFLLFIKERLTTAVQGNAQLGATKPGFFNSLLSRHCQKKCAQGVKSFNSNARFKENICCLHLVHTRLLFQYKATSRQLRQTSFYKRHKRRCLE